MNKWIIGSIIALAFLIVVPFSLSKLSVDTPTGFAVSLNPDYASMQTDKLDESLEQAEAYGKLQELFKGELYYTKIDFFYPRWVDGKVDLDCLLVPITIEDLIQKEIEQTYGELPFILYETEDGLVFARVNIDNGNELEALAKLLQKDNSEIGRLIKLVEEEKLQYIGLGIPSHIRYIDSTLRKYAESMDDVSLFELEELGRIFTANIIDTTTAMKYYEADAVLSGVQAEFIGIGHIHMYGNPPSYKDLEHDKEQIVISHEQDKAIVYFAQDGKYAELTQMEYTKQINEMDDFIDIKGTIVHRFGGKKVKLEVKDPSGISSIKTQYAGKIISEYFGGKQEVTKTIDLEDIQKKQFFVVDMNGNINRIMFGRIDGELWYRIAN